MVVLLTILLVAVLYPSPEGLAAHLAGMGGRAVVGRPVGDRYSAHPQMWEPGARGRPQASWLWAVPSG